MFIQCIHCLQICFMDEDRICEELDQMFCEFCDRILTSNDDESLDDESLDLPELPF